jgi:hypothetical protein
MIAPSRQPLPFEAAQRMLPPAATPLRRAAALGDSGTALLAGALGFFCFLPYPAYSVGNTSALQIGNVFTLLMILPVFTLAWRGRPFWIFPLILAPLVLSALKVAVVGGGDVGVCFKTIAMWALSCLTLLIPPIYARRHALDLLTGMALATLLHAGIGIWQYYSFAHGIFPLTEMYVNQSFLSVQDNAHIIAKYTQRPFGLFPEPSAMSSSLAPFILIWVAHLCGILKFKHAPAPWQQVLFAAAAAGGVGLMILSQSGHTAVTLAALVVFAVVWFKRCRATIRTYTILVGMLGVVMPLVLWVAALSLGNRVGGSEMGNSSWAERSDSLRIGFSLLVGGDVPRILCGMGAGMMAPALWSVAQIDAVFSVLLTYVYETGLVGAIAVGCIGIYLVRVWKSIRFDLAFAVIGFVWLVGMTVTTSYEQLLPLWMALGWLAVWPEIFETKPPVASVAQPSHGQVPEQIAEPGVRWTPAQRMDSPSSRLNRRWNEQ